MSYQIHLPSTQAVEPGSYRVVHDTLSCDVSKTTSNVPVTPGRIPIDPMYSGPEYATDRLPLADTWAQIVSTLPSKAFVTVPPALVEALPDGRFMRRYRACKTSTPPKGRS